jgi:REP element-mobilizing transposase RayT
MSNKPAPLQPALYYHLFSRGNNRENVFIEERNYDYFMALYAKHFSAVADTFAYCLMPNHFHFLVRIKTPGVFKTPGVSINPSQQFGNFLNAYSKAVNKAYGRTGSLFQNRFGRKVVDSDAYFLALIAYIHRNPEHHGLVSDFRKWNHSSYHVLLSIKETRLCRDEVIGWFGDQERFKEFHQREPEIHQISQLIDED